MRLSRVLLMSAALILSACGFHLRGTGPEGVTPLSPLAVSGSEAPEIERLLVAGIQRMGGEVLADAPLRLVLVSETVNRQSSVQDPRVQAFERTLFYELSFQLRHASGVPALAQRDIRLRRQFQFDNTRIVGKFEEENLLIDDMRQQAVAQLLTQLTRIKPDDLSPDVAPKPLQPGDLMPVDAIKRNKR